MKLKGLFAVRSEIKAKRVKEHGNPKYSREITQVAKRVAGPLLWPVARMLVETRDVVVFKLMGRRKHPKNIYG